MLVMVRNGDFIAKLSPFLSPSSQTCQCQNGQPVEQKRLARCIAENGGCHLLVVEFVVGGQEEGRGAAIGGMMSRVWINQKGRLLVQSIGGSGEIAGERLFGCRC